MSPTSNHLLDSLTWIDHGSTRKDYTMWIKTSLTIEHQTKDDIPLDDELASFAEFVKALRTVAEHTPYVVNAQTEYDLGNYDFSDAEQYRRPKKSLLKGP